MIVTYTTFQGIVNGAMILAGKKVATIKMTAKEFELFKDRFKEGVTFRHA